MPVRRPDRPRRQTGFTLVELLVVLVILGTLVGLAVLAGSGGHARALADQAQRLEALIGLLADEAVLDNREYGVRFEADGYRILRFTSEQGRWEPAPGHRAQPLPAWMTLDLQQSDAAPLLAGAEGVALPQLTLLSSGELSPFALALRDRDSGAAWRLSSDGFALPEAVPEARP